MNKGISSLALVVIVIIAVIGILAIVSILIPSLTKSSTGTYGQVYTGSIDQCRTGETSCNSNVILKCTQVDVGTGGNGMPLKVYQSDKSCPSGTTCSSTIGTDGLSVANCVGQPSQTVCTEGQTAFR